MSDSDSFINEVTEEVRKEQLFGYIRRYGWIAVLVVLLVVGGTAFSEYRKAQATNAAQSAGNALLEALEINEFEPRAEALAAIEVEGGPAAVTNLLASANLIENGDAQGAADLLGAVAVQQDIPQIYRDLALLKSAMMEDSGQSVEERRVVLEGLAAPGATFRLVAEEQLALLDVQDGDTEAALARFSAIAQDADVTRGLRDRAFGMIVALDGDVEAVLSAFGAALQNDQ